MQLNILQFTDSTPTKNDLAQKANSVEGEKHGVGSSCHPEPWAPLTLGSSLPLRFHVDGSVPKHYTGESF